MNYRRGFQRLYAVLTVAWVALLLFALPSDRLKFWSMQPNDWATVHGPWEKDPALPDQSRYGTVTPAPPKSKFGGIPVDEPFKPPPLSSEEKPTGKFVPPPLESEGKPANVFEETAKSGDWKIWTESGSDQPPSRAQKGLWLAGALFGPPVFGYAAIFLVIPWVYRGFRPASTSLTGTESR
jgi:hypothetical protein